MREIHLPYSLEVGGDGKPNISLKEGEVVIAITEDEIILAVDALRARAQQASERQLRAWTIEGEGIHSERVDTLAWLEQSYDEIAGKLILASKQSWKSSDQRKTEREAYEIAVERRAAFRASAEAVEPVTKPAPSLTT